MEWWWVYKNCTWENYETFAMGGTVSSPNSQIKALTLSPQNVILERGPLERQWWSTEDIQADPKPIYLCLSHWRRSRYTSCKDIGTRWPVKRFWVISDCAQRAIWELSEPRMASLWDKCPTAILWFQPHNCIFLKDPSVKPLSRVFYLGFQKLSYKEGSGLGSERIRRPGWLLRNLCAIAYLVWLGQTHPPGLIIKHLLPTSSSRGMTHHSRPLAQIRIHNQPLSSTQVCNSGLGMKKDPGEQPLARALGTATGLQAPFLRHF